MCADLTETQADWLAEYVIWQDHLVAYGFLVNHAGLAKWVNYAERSLQANDR
jgi:hypothetical protein